MAKHFTERLILDEVNLKILKENRPKTGGFNIFKKSFLGQFFNNVKANWIMLIFCIPAAIWLIMSKVNQMSLDTTIPYSGNLAGYPIVNDAHIVGAYQDYQLALKRALYMMPLIIIGSVGLAGIFNVVKYFTWDFEIKIFKTFFRGIKNSYAHFLWVGMMLSICYLLLAFVFNIFNVYPSVHIAWKVISYVVVILFCLFVILISIFITTQASVFNLTLLETIKNSFILAFRFPLQNILIAIAGLLSMILPFITFNYLIQMIAYMLFFMTAFSWTASVWTVYTHYIYDLMYVEKPKPQKAAQQKKNSSKMTNNQAKKR